MDRNGRSGLHGLDESFCLSPLYFVLDGYLLIVKAVRSRPVASYLTVMETYRIGSQENLRGVEFNAEAWFVRLMHTV